MANLAVRVDFIENGRGGHYLVQNGFKFHIKTRRNNRCYWRCVNGDCPASLTTVDNLPTGAGRPHNHTGDIIEVAASAFINNVKKRCRDEVCPIPTIFDDELSKLRNQECDDTTVEMIRQIPTFHGCKSSLYRSRSKVLPKLPSSTNEAEIEGSLKETLAGERFLLCDDTDARGERILIFATDENLRLLCNATIIFGDGTFYACPRIFSQLYSLHASVDGTVHPLVFAFLPNKTERTYVRFFTLLKDAIQERHSVLTPETVILDFETAARNAVNLVFPMTTLRGCLFHFCQCIWRKTQDCGLATRYKDGDSVRTLVRRAAVLPLIPENRIEDVWFYALDQNEDDSAAVTRFTDYVTETWVDGSIPKASWNHYDHDGPRTTNHVEGWHNRLNKLCTHSHPNIFISITTLKKEQAAIEAKIIQIGAGGKQPPRKKKYRLLNSRLVNLKEKLSNGQLTLFQYADAASHFIHLD